MKRSEEFEQRHRLLYLAEVKGHPGPYNGRFTIMNRLEKEGWVAWDGGWVLTTRGEEELAKHMEQEMREYEDPAANPYAYMSREDMAHSLQQMAAQIATLQREKAELEMLVAQQCEIIAGGGGAS